MEPSSKEKFELYFDKLIKQSEIKSLFTNKKKILLMKRLLHLRNEQKTIQKIKLN